MFRLFLSTVLLLLGAGLAGGGAWLAWLGGSPFYLVLGLATLIVSALLFARRPAALWLYALMLVATLGWSLWEVGFDWWALSARGSLLVVIGILLLTPPAVRSLTAAGELRAAGKDVAGPLAWFELEGTWGEELDARIDFALDIAARFAPAAKARVTLRH